ncbi:MAG: ATP-dependent Clp protease adaptor ClpS [Sandaracinus sp.]|nr:ATP-dependent Clp protease adaptor ClpS [Sandaracinus sp.]|tara:strand:- start:2887 stop:3216 length:330 start_codon:yes stop_codon:yes gene_type:complete
MPEWEDERDGGAGTVTETRSEPKVAKPRLFKVLMHNDDYTTRDFVVWVLQSVFHKSENDAVRVMLHVHQTGVGVCGLYTREVAETKVQKTERLAREHEYPLRLSMEPEE